MHHLVGDRKRQHEIQPEPRRLLDPAEANNEETQHWERERETGVKMNPALMRVLVNFLKDNGIKPDGSPMTPRQADATSSAAATTP